MTKTSGGSCCSCKNVRVFLREPLHSIKLTQIAFIILDLLATESAFIFLRSIKIDWRRGGFPGFDLQRVILILSLITTSGILVLLFNEWKKRRSVWRTARCSSCDGLRKDVKPSEYKSTSRCDWDFADYIHSLLNAASFIVCALCMIAYVPDDYEHPMEVGIKVGSFLLDLVLCLLFTKSCMAAYMHYQVPEPCKCPDKLAGLGVYYDSSTTPSSVSLSDDDAEQTVLFVKPKFRKVDGKAYASLTTEDDI
uniref:Uncharacterized protein LOC100175247 n=1 Tax=Phallusia mammillata TaxID=59560 RepID=A0A6F9DGF7_9ASCI|nr:uncharacterized protein LOC100175247 [Phallusia mammillata]